jgi:CRISPR-associated endoribonuclease Cas6
MLNYTKISVIIKPKDRLPYFIGSQLRGAFGYALKKTVCINPSFECDACFAKSNCIYHDFYEAKNEYHNYRFDFELGKDYYYFNLYLFDSACQSAPYIVSALYQMISKIGFGKDRVTYTDFDMYVNDNSILENNQIKLPADYKTEFSLDSYCPDIMIKFITPIRIKKQNKFLRDDIELIDILSSINRRYYDLINQDYQKLSVDNSFEVISKEIQYKELTRRSNRQKTTMNLGGLLGELKIKNIDQKTYELLKIAEVIGVGKQTVFGLGKIKIEEIKECK